VEQDRVARLGGGDGGAQRFHVGVAGGGVMREGLQLAAEVGENLGVVRPAWRAHPEARHARTLGHGEGEAQRAGATGCLHAVDATGGQWRRAAPEDIGFQPLDEAHVALWPEVGLGLLGLQQDLLGRLDRAEHRGITLAGAIDPDAEVDLVGPRIDVMELDQREQRVGGLLGQVREHDGARLAAWGARGKAIPFRLPARGSESDPKFAEERISKSVPARLAPPAQPPINGTLWVVGPGPREGDRAGTDYPKRSFGSGSQNGTQF
jgi:hypothetical protein